MSLYRQFLAGKCRLGEMKSMVYEKGAVAYLRQL